VVREVQGVRLVLPWSHRLPDYATAGSSYGQNLVELARLLGAGPRPLTVMDVGANVGDSVLQILNATERVKEGQSLAKSLETEKIFPDLAVEMLEVGESTGALPAMLSSVAEFYEEDVQTALGAAMALIEPMILIVMAVFVGGILISLYLPIFTLGAGVH